MESVETDSNPLEGWGGLSKRGKAALLMVKGWAREQVCLRVGIRARTLQTWERSDGEYAGLVQRFETEQAERAYRRAQQVMMEQMEHPDPSVAWRAANALLNHSARLSTRHVRVIPTESLTINLPPIRDDDGQ